MPSVNYRSAVHEEMEFDCSAEYHSEVAAIGDLKCDICSQEIDVDNVETGLKIGRKEYLRLKAEQHERIIRIEALSREWSCLNSAMEQEDFRRQMDAEDGLDHEPEFDTDEEQAAYYARREVDRQMKLIKLESIEAQLEALNARMARPYEHHNEDEALMEYLERDRGDY